MPAPRKGQRPAPAVTWLIPFLLLIGSVVAVPLHIFDEQGLPRYRALKAELSELKSQNRRIVREVRVMEREARALRSDPGAIERIARDELGMIRDDELVFQFEGEY